MPLAGVYFYAAAICTTIITYGGPGWLNLLVLLFICNALKFRCIGAVWLDRVQRERGPYDLSDGLKNRQS